MRRGNVILLPYNINCFLTFLLKQVSCENGIYMAKLLLVRNMSQIASFWFSNITFCRLTVSFTVHRKSEDNILFIYWQFSTDVSYIWICKNKNTFESIDVLHWFYLFPNWLICLVGHLNTSMFYRHLIVFLAIKNTFQVHWSVYI